MRKLCVRLSSVVVAMMLFVFARESFAQGGSDFSSASAWQSNGSMAQLADGGIPESTGSPGVIDPYFANLGVLGWLHDTSKVASALKYIQWYVNRINPAGSPDV